MAKAKTSMKGVRDPSVTLEAAGALDLRGKSALVVGGTDGLGRAIAQVMAERGARVTVVGRTFRDEGAPGLSFVRADLSSMAEAQRLGRELPAEALDVVVLTTGIFAAPGREVTAEGVERDMAISYLSRFALLRELAGRLGHGRAPGSPRPRVFVMGFPGAGQTGEPSDLNADREYDAMKVHMNTVAANEALVLDAARRHPSVGFFGLNPGLVKTKIRANFLGEGSLKHRVAEALIGLFTISARRYAERTVPVLFAPELEGRTGLMFNPAPHAILPTDGLTPERVERFAEASEALLERALRPSRPAARSGSPRP